MTTSKQCYVVSINLASELDDTNYTTLFQITKNYIQKIKGMTIPYIQRYEFGSKGGKLHAHIAYKPDTIAKNTSNETRKFRCCYEDYFCKKKYPKCIDHKAFDCWQKAIGYVGKDSEVQTEFTGTESGITDKELSEAIKQYESRPKKVTKVRNIYTANMFLEDFIIWCKDHEMCTLQHHELFMEYMMLEETKAKVNWTIFSKLGIGKMLDYTNYKVNNYLKLSKKVKSEDYLYEYGNNYI